MVNAQAPAILGPPATTASAADLVAGLLEERGVVAVIELAGGMITRLLDAVHRLGRTPIVSPGMVRQFQESYMDSRFQPCLGGYSPPSFAAVAEAYGIPARQITEPDEASQALQWLNSARPGPALLEVAVDTLTNAFPKIAFGSPITVMEHADESDD